MAYSPIIDHPKDDANETRRCALKLNQLVAIAVVSGGLDLSAVEPGIGRAHAEPTPDNSVHPGSADGAL
jgi:hypothetical protein